MRQVKRRGADAREAGGLKAEVFVGGQARIGGGPCLDNHRGYEGAVARLGTMILGCMPHPGAGAQVGGDEFGKYLLD